MRTKKHQESFSGERCQQQRCQYPFVNLRFYPCTIKLKASNLAPMKHSKLYAFAKWVVKKALLLLSILVLASNGMILLTYTLRKVNSALEDRHDMLMRRAGEREQDLMLRIYSPQKWGEVRNERLLKRASDIGYVITMLLTTLLALAYTRSYIRSRRRKKTKKRKKK